MRRLTTLPTALQHESSDDLLTLSWRVSKSMLVLGVLLAVFFALRQGPRAAFVLTLAMVAVIVQWRGLTARVQSLVPFRPPAAEARDAATSGSGIPTAESSVGWPSIGALRSPLPRYFILAATYYLLFQIGRDQPQALVAGVLLLPSALIVEVVRAAVLASRQR